MGLGTMTSREMHRSDSGQMLFAPQYPARAPEVNYAKETSYSINQLERRNRLEREGSTESKSASPVPSSKASSVSGHTTASMASYRETKNYLLKQGFTSREVLDAPTIFHLRNYAIKKGVDITPLQKELATATSAVEAARSASKEAAQRAETAAREAREAQVVLQRATPTKASAHSHVAEPQPDEPAETSPGGSPVKGIRASSSSTLAMVQARAAASASALGSFMGGSSALLPLLPT